MTTRNLHEYVYCLDGDDRIVRVSPQWLSFAVNNEAPGLTREAVVGKPVGVFMAGWDTASLYEAVYRGVRRTGATVTLPFRCDSPRTRRFMELEIRPLRDDSLELTGRLRRREARAYMPLLDPLWPRRGDYVLICSLCRRLPVPGDDRWVEVEEAMDLLDLDPQLPLPRLSHTVCDDCRRRVLTHLAEVAG